MFKKRYIFLLFALSAVVLAACGGRSTIPPAETVTGKPVAVEGGVYMDVDVAEMQTMLQNKDFVFVNVHIPFEGNIPGTDVSIPFDQIEPNLSKLPADKNAKIVVYCRSGAMSAIAARTLVKLGYTNVWNLAGGMIAWQQGGLPLEMTP